MSRHDGGRKDNNVRLGIFLDHWTVDVGQGIRHGNEWSRMAGQYGCVDDM